MYILLKNDFKIDRTKDKQQDSDQKITVNWIHYAVQKGFANGLSSDKRRLFFTLAEKLEKAIKNDEEYVEVNSVEQQFLKIAFENAIIDAKFTSGVSVAESAVLNPVESLPPKE